jgi:hypothetical protein
LELVQCSWLWLKNKSYISRIRSQNF